MQVAACINLKIAIRWMYSGIVNIMPILFSVTDLWSKYLNFTFKKTSLWIHIDDIDCWLILNRKYIASAENLTWFLADQRQELLYGIDSDITAATIGSDSLIFHRFCFGEFRRRFGTARYEGFHFAFRLPSYHHSGTERSLSCRTHCKYPLEGGFVLWIENWKGDWRSRGLGVIHPLVDVHVHADCMVVLVASDWVTAGAWNSLVRLSFSATLRLWVPTIFL